ncbi:tRNA dimethylallyltransferase [Zhouia amylolytica]|uniref:tRNA dimethylallyltransferase n=1 Tax=Zhouia amylolytica TaxID=376730 RepID=A0A1I6QXI6_9FLAO|nr:tRNA (adenosine(37)-N6)-dimethylallyltransferase MiaA [Zhouia amylolytica]MCQ0110826.1 tRNA (adenosine(37)-N6)-dimethylallyltransferase MiaA [Zhouia amylolytica]SFS57189.1 tRNA dimethylallyltransferase [Zhouia amylolytica]
MKEPEKYLITVVGPTAIGKTSLAIKLAKHYHTEILSCDSRQFFKEMYIGTAVPSEKELNEAQHHFIQHISIFDSYSVGDFERDAILKLSSLFKDNNVVVMAGGSGLYLNAVIKGLDEFPEVPEHIRTELNKLYENQGIEALQVRLKELDPVHYEKMDIQNPQRVIRALEICIASNKPYSSFLNQKKVIRPFKSIVVGLTANREVIYDRINKRVDIMIENGLIEEAKRLFTYRKLNALQTVGYKELFKYFEGEYTKEFAISEVKKNTRRFAKRQLTWFNRHENTLWFDFNTPLKEIIEKIEMEK